MSTKAELMRRLEGHVARLEGGELSGDAHKRARKRIMAKIGAIKRELSKWQDEKTSAAPVATSRPPRPTGDAGRAERTKAIGVNSEQTANRADDMDVESGGHGVAAERKRAIKGVESSMKQKIQGESSERKGKRRKVDLERATSQPAPVKSTDSEATMLSLEMAALAPPMDKAKRKKKLKHLNTQLSQLAQRKQLAAALKAFTKAEKSGLVDAHTYANMMNAYVRCGDVNGCTEMFARLRKRGLTPGVVHFTVHLKGLCEAGRVQEAAKTLAVMSTAGVVPNLRTLNTFLRGCVRAGETTLAETAFSKFRSVWNVEPDASSYEALGTLLSQELQLSEHLELIRQLRAAVDTVASNSTLAKALGGEVDAASNPAMYLACARAATLLGEWDIATTAVAMARGELDHDRFLRRQHESSDATNSSGGRERARSMRQFARHRLEELKREADFLESYIVAEAKAAENPSTHLSRLFSTYRRVLHFGQAYTPLDPAALATHLVGELNRFGFARAAKSLDVKQAKLAEDVESSVANCVGVDGRLDLCALFPHSELPLKLELCAGSGEWAAAQAAGDASRKKGANWVALELRTDRVHDCFTHAVFGRLENLAVIGGDAAAILESHMPRCAHSIYINHPEPPERTGGVDDSEGHHLLTSKFFTVMKQVLLSTGQITLVTDNLAYGKSLALTASAAGFRSVEGAQSEDYPGAVHLLEGLPGPDFGHSTEASSYFDRLWNEGNKVTRYWFAVMPSDT